MMDITRNIFRRGLTLIELLVALAVISLLAGIALPTVKNTLKGQRVSRATSLLKSAIEEGRARAIANGGGGVIIDRQGFETAIERGQSVSVRLAEAPPAFTGDTPQATARYQFVIDGGSNFGNGSASISNPAGPLRGSSNPPAEPGNPYFDYHLLLFDFQQFQMLRSARDLARGSKSSLINVGDQIGVGNVGLPMTIASITELDPNSVPASSVPWAFWSGNDPNDPLPAGYPGGYVMVEVIPQEKNIDLRRFSGSRVGFSVGRSPRPAIAIPIEMPKGTAIDLTASGMGRYGNEFSPMWADGNYLDDTLPPFTAAARDYESVYILFGSRGEVSRVITSVTNSVTGLPQLNDLPVTGDIHFLVGHAGQVKMLPDDQLEDNDGPNPLADEAKDGRTPLLDPESAWVTIRARNGEVLAAPWIDPTDPADSTTQLIPVADPPATRTDATRQTRIRTVIGRTRSAAVESRDGGSL